MELAGVPARAAFLNDDLYRVPVSGAPSGDYVARLTDSQPLGQELKKVLNVTKGDTITFSALAQWKPNATAGGSSATPYVLAGAAAGLNPLSQRGAEGQATAYTTTSPNWLSLLAAGMGFTLGGGGQAASLGNTSLTGWIKYRVLDEGGTEVASGRDYLLGTGQWEYLQTGVRIPQNGTIEVMAGTTGTGEAVYFDNLRVEQTGGLIVQEQHQYAFGAPLPGLSYAVGTKRYRYGYQGQYAEHDEETGFESFQLRLYNSRVGRWMSYDPEGQYDSPYVGMGNNPVSGVDPDGGWSGWKPLAKGLHRLKTGEIVGTAARASRVMPAVSTAVRSVSAIQRMSEQNRMIAKYGSIHQTPSHTGYSVLSLMPPYQVANAIYLLPQMFDIGAPKKMLWGPYVGQQEAAGSFYGTIAGIGLGGATSTVQPVLSRAALIKPTLNGYTTVKIGSKHLASGGGKYAKFATSSLNEAESWTRQAIMSSEAELFPNDAQSLTIFTNMRKVIGTKGEQIIKAIVDRETGQVITAYPAKSMPKP
jgi:RHS repeat-associated protein